MNDTILSQRGQELSLRFTWWQGAPGGDALDLTGAVLTVRESNRDGIRQGAVVNIDDADAGVSLMTLSEANADNLGDGRTNWFRIEAQWPDGSNRVTPKIWINVQ